jgi:MarR family transcriptional regulator for hemolysin
MTRSQLCEQFGRLVGDAYRLWRLRMNERLRPLGLSQARWLTLRVLRRAGDAIPQTELAARIGIEAPTLVRILDGLARSGYIARRISSSDRRVRTVHLTAKAQRKLGQIEAVADQLRLEVTSGLETAALANAVALLEQVQARLVASAPPQPAARETVARRRRPARHPIRSAAAPSRSR